MNNNNNGTRVDLSTPQAMDYWLKVFGCKVDVLIEACRIASSGSEEDVGSAIVYVTKQRAQKARAKRRLVDVDPSPW